MVTRNKEYFKKYYLDHKQKYIEDQRKYSKSPRGQFTTQRRRAIRRGLGWELTFEQWLEFWGNDLNKRGRGPDELCMARKGDIGPYSVENIYKTTNAQNRELYYKSGAHSSWKRRANGTFLPHTIQNSQT